MLLTQHINISLLCWLTDDWERETGPMAFITASGVKVDGITTLTAAEGRWGWEVRERERERQRQTEAETDRQRQTDREIETETETERQTDREEEKDSLLGRPDASNTFLMKRLHSPHPPPPPAPLCLSVCLSVCLCKMLLRENCVTLAKFILEAEKAKRAAH